MPTHVRDIAAVSIRAQLRHEFETFIQHAPFEDLWLLLDTLGFANSVPESLAESFHYRLRDGAAFVRVPRRHRNRVEAFIETLSAVEGKVA